MSQGLEQAAKQLQSYGRGPDTMLAHISPDEAHFIDYLQGGTKTNPQTGLPEYSLFGKILKSVAKAAGAIVGYQIAGPAGAALGAGLTTKATGGSWNDALKAGAISGGGSYAAQGLTGGGWNPLGSGVGTPGAQAAAFNGTAPPSFLQDTLSTAKSLPGIAAGAGALMGGSGGSGTVAPLPAPPGSNVNLNVSPLNRGRIYDQGDYAHWGEQAGPHQFFRNANPMPQFITPGQPVPTAAPTATQEEQEIAFRARGGAIRARMRRGIY